MYHFIINPCSRSGHGKKIWKIVNRYLDEHKIAYTSHFTHYECHATKLAASICSDNNGGKHIIVLGGDGTVNEVINGISSYQDVILSYIPSGSSNDLARSLGISKNPIVALESILKSQTFPYYDHGMLTIKDTDQERKFAVSTGIGFDASICYEALGSKIKYILNLLKLGKLTYVLIGIKQLIQYKPTDGAIIIDQGEEITLKNIFFIASMIHPYEGGGLKLAPHTNPSDHKISVCVFYDIPKRKAAIVIPSLFFGKHTGFKGVKIFECTNVTIKTKDSLILHTDGEFAGRSNHIQVSCLPEQIRMSQ